MNACIEFYCTAAYTAFILGCVFMCYGMFLQLQLGLGRHESN